MAYKKNAHSSTDRKSPEDAFAEQLTESVIQSLKEMKDSKKNFSEHYLSSGSSLYVTTLKPKGLMRRRSSETMKVG